MKWWSFTRRSDALHAVRGGGEGLEGRIKLARERKWVPVGETKRKGGRRRQEKEGLLEKNNRKESSWGTGRQTSSGWENQTRSFNTASLYFLFFSSSLCSPQTRIKLVSANVYFWMSWQEGGLAC